MVQNWLFIIKCIRGGYKLKDLPKVFASPINKEIHNNKDIFYSTKSLERKSDVNVPRKINEIFASSSHVYKSKVNILLDQGEIEAIIVGKTGNYLLDITGKRININDIRDIERA